MNKKTNHQGLSSVPKQKNIYPLLKGEKMISIRIENKIGRSRDTVVFSHKGQPIRGITKIEIRPLEPNNLVVATLTFDCVELAISATWELHPLKQWANRKTGK